MIPFYGIDLLVNLAYFSEVRFMLYNTAWCDSAIFYTSSAVTCAIKFAFIRIEYYNKT